MNPAGVSRRRRRRGTVRVRPRVDIEWARRYGPAPAVVVRRSVDGVCGCHSSCGVDMLNARMFVVVRSTNVRFHIDDVVQTGVVVRLQCEGKELLETALVFRFEKGRRTDDSLERDDLASVSESPPQLDRGDSGGVGDPLFMK